MRFGICPRRRWGLLFWVGRPALNVSARSCPFSDHLLSIPYFPILHYFQRRSRPAGRNIFLPARAPCGFAAFCAALVVATGRIKQMCAALYKAGFATLLVLRRLQVFIGRCIIYNIVKYEGIF